ncbi:MAG: hypothetical protein ACRDJU_11575, partial [Actinomycetota bacterium]
MGQTANGEDLRFSLSLASGPGTQSVQASSVDPCPAPPPGSSSQIVDVFAEPQFPVSPQIPLTTGTVKQ